MSQPENNTTLTAAEKAIIIGVSVALFSHVIAWMIMDSTRLGNHQKRTSEISILFEQEEEKEESELSKELASMQAEIGIPVNANKTNKASNRDKTQQGNRVDNFRKRAKSLSAMDKQNLFSEDRIQEKQNSEKDATLEEAKDWLGKRSKKNSSFTGQSRVNYQLEGRVARVLPVPVYTCERAGKVWVDIWVDRMGRVSKAEINHANSTLKTVCAKETALRYVKASRFSLGKEEVQKGFVSYEFVAQ